MSSLFGISVNWDVVGQSVFWGLIILFFLFLVSLFFNYFDRKLGTKYTVESKILKKQPVSYSVNVFRRATECTFVCRLKIDGLTYITAKNQKSIKSHRQGTNIKVSYILGRFTKEKHCIMIIS